MTELLDAEFVIIGGGAVGCAVAYSLVEAGQTDVLVLEREESLASATTAQAAGLVGQVRSSVERTRLAMWSVKTFAALEADADVRPSWRQVGSLRIALNDGRVEEFHRLISIAQSAGLEVELIDRAAAQRLWPILQFECAKAILWCPTDGYLQPYDLTMAYQHHARARGARFATRTAVTNIACKNGHVESVETTRGRVACRVVINAAGAHAYHIARLVGLDLPIVPVRHEYLISVPMARIVPTLPAFRVPDATLYGRPEVNSLLLGGWEPQAMSSLPQAFSLAEHAPPIREDWEVLARFAEQFAPLYPPVQEAGVRCVFRGWPTFVPDGRFIVGESCRVNSFVMAGGCNAHGVSGSAGIGRHVVESILDPHPSDYVKSLSPDRFTETAWDWPTARRQAQRVYETYYALDH